MIEIALLGCTGSIGAQTLDVARSAPDKIKIKALACGSNVRRLAELAREFDCRILGIADKSKYEELKTLAPRGSEIYCGDEALTSIARCAKTVVNAVVGMIGLKAVLSALDVGAVVALANKESLVAGGELVRAALKKGGEIRPVDSEHSAVWQVLRGDGEFKRIILTASGGPFYFRDGDLSDVTVEQAVAHPNWKMGRKISVDSATMMNKALEIIEARWLFDTTSIDYVIHPESVVHSMVEYADGSIKAQAGFPDMRLPIQYAIFGDHAEREYKPLKLPLGLRFLPPDETRFPAPKFAKAVIHQGGNAAVVLNAANEAAVRLFLERKIAFTDIVEIVGRTLEKEQFRAIETADDVFETHKRIYDKIYCI